MVATEKTPALSNDVEQALLAMGAAREGTLALVAPIAESDLERVHSPIMSPLVWDLGHIAAYEDLWLGHRLCGMPLLRPELADLYDAFETPRSVRGEIEVLRPAQARDYLAAVRERAAEALGHVGLGDGTVCEMVLRHELQHCETMRQTMAIAGLLGDEDRSAMDRPLAQRGEADEFLEIPAGRFAMGCGDTRFAYDNERPRQLVDVPAFRIARHPVTNASWMRFSEGGGYERREWWSDEGWAWKEEFDITHHHSVAAGHPRAAACHVSWFEADAFARAHGARLPSEAEWEKAATWTQGSDGTERGAPATRGGGTLASGEGRGARRSLPGMGMDPEPFRRLSRLHRTSVPRVLGGVLRRGLPRAPRRLVGDEQPGRDADVPQLGPAAAAADLRGRSAGEGRSVMEPVTDADEVIQIDSHLDSAHERSLAEDVLDGLTRPFKELPPKHFYDARGAELFDQICELPEYYPTRAERAILEQSAEELATLTGAVELVELGSGTAAKTRVLLDALQANGTLYRYVPVDVTEQMVRDCAAELTREYPGLRVHGVIGDFERHLDRVPPAAGPRIVAFLGGTIGNFPPGSRRRVLREIGRLLGPEDHLLMGTDLVKDPEVLEAAYDDAQGVTAEFNRNVLRVLNRELQADFDPDDFDHVALFDRENEWIEMRLRAKREHTTLVRDLDLPVHFDAGEELRTEISAKFTPMRLEADLSAAGLELVRWLTDPEELFALTLSRRTPGRLA
ncbi:MAG: egtD [Solirubrobacterales bacterium]|nr:egtD [Solirubrobacterales bacterium]